MDKSQKDKAIGTAQKTATLKKTEARTFTNTTTATAFTSNTTGKPAVWNGYRENLNCQIMPNEAPKELIMELQSLALRYGVLKSTQASLMEEYAVLRKTFVELLEAYKMEKKIKGLDLDKHLDEYWLEKAWLL